MDMLLSNTTLNLLNNLLDLSILVIRRRNLKLREESLALTNLSVAKE
jgi:hypothetical protein